MRVMGLLQRKVRVMGLLQRKVRVMETEEGESDGDRGR